MEMAGFRRERGDPGTPRLAPTQLGLVAGIDASASFDVA
jgi:hypothetical protein